MSKDLQVELETPSFDVAVKTAVEQGGFEYSRLEFDQLVVTIGYRRITYIYKFKAYR